MLHQCQSQAWMNTEGEEHETDPSRSMGPPPILHQCQHCVFIDCCAQHTAFTEMEVISVLMTGTGFPENFSVKFTEIDLRAN